jgi:hypothetical protein
MSEKSPENAIISPNMSDGSPDAARTVRLVAFYLGVPLIIGAYGALNNWQLLENAGYLWTLAFYAGHALIPWWITCASTSAAMWALRSIKPPPYALMAIGSILGGFIVLPYTNWLTGLSGAEFKDAHLAQQIAPIFSVEFWSFIARATIVWFAINFVFDRFLGLPRYRYVIPRGYDFRRTPPANENPDPGVEAHPLPGFVERIPADLRIDDILAVKAEQHYIRVYTPNQEYMVLYRFSDAVRDLSEIPGLQVHRSYWVSKYAIDCIRPSAKKFTLKLNTGVNVPVSTPYHGIVKEFARANQVPTR